MSVGHSVNSAKLYRKAAFSRYSGSGPARVGSANDSGPSNASAHSSVCALAQSAGKVCRHLPGAPVGRGFTMALAQLMTH
jgi:hypothetical protein